MIQILVNGANGKMGQTVVQMIAQEPTFKLIGKTDKQDDLSEKIRTLQPDLVIDFTHPSVGYENTKIILENGIRPIIGTTGFLPEQISTLKKLALEKKIGGIIAPNFSLGAVLMMKYAEDAAKYFPNVEIIEFHHDAKADSPSGTAIKTAEMMTKVKHKKNNSINEKETIVGARGAAFEDIHIHAVRLPGFVANQDVIFGGLGETLKISHQTISREAFMPGVKLACQKAMQLNELVYGLENIL